MKHVIYVMFGMIVFVFPAWAELPESPMDVPVEDVLNSVELKEIGFPFVNLRPSKIISMGPGMNLVDKCPEFDIGRCIVYLYQSGQMVEDKRAEKLDGILQKYVNQNAQIHAWINDGALSFHDTSLSRDMLTAALVLGADTGTVKNIVPYLEYSNLYIGHSEIAWEYPLEDGSMMMMGPTNYTSEQRLKLWPAQNAIISHATTTVPLLREAAVDQSLPILLRQRAVGYLLYLDKDILRSDLLKDCEREFLEKCIMIGIPSFPWKNMEKDEVKRIKEFREQSHLRLLFNKKTRGYLDRLIEEENKGSGE